VPGLRQPAIGGPLPIYLNMRMHAQHHLRVIVQGPAYGTAYNRLQAVLAKEDRLGTTGCPEESF
jgi:hypothetical protein